MNILRNFSSLAKLCTSSPFQNNRDIQYVIKQMWDPRFRATVRFRKTAEGRVIGKNYKLSTFFSFISIIRYIAVSVYITILLLLLQIYLRPTQTRTPLEINISVLIDFYELSQLGWALLLAIHYSNYNKFLTYLAFVVQCCLHF